MGFTVTTGIYRTCEEFDNFRTSYFMQIFGDRVTIQGVSGKITRNCIREIKDWASLNGIKFIEYERRKNGVARTMFIKCKSEG